MAATITASMAGELARKIVAPTATPTKAIDNKLKEINETVRINDYNMTVEKMLLN